MNIVTSGTIASELGIDRDRVSYALRKVGIKPIGRAGMVRLFPASAVGTVKNFFRERSRRDNHDAT